MRTKILLALPLTLAAFAQAQDRSADIDKIFNWTKPAEPGCSVAVSQDGKPVVNKGYGSADLERDVPISANTIFDAGSVRKQFVAAAILLLADEGKLSLTDDIRKYVPEMPDYGDVITIDARRRTLTLEIGAKDLAARRRKWCCWGRTWIRGTWAPARSTTHRGSASPWPRGT